MAKIARRSRKAGLPPGTLVHIGEEPRQTAKVTVADYDEISFYEKEIDAIQECFVFKNKPSVTWVNVDGLKQVDVIQNLGDCYGLHPLVMEDILNTEQRSKMEDYKDYIYVVVKMLHQDKGPDIVTEQISLIIGSNFVFSFQEGIEGDVFNPVRERLRNGKGRIRSMGSDYLAYSLIDAVVDNYFVILEKIAEKIEILEEELIENPTSRTMHKIHHLKREIIFFRRAVWPLREVIAGLERGDSPLIKDSTRVYLRDVYDHTIQVIDAVETYREMLSGMVDIYLSSISNRMNEIIKFLTLIGTIFIPLTFIAGVYGMNFKYMPELEWHWGYPAIWAGMVLVTAVMLAYFRKKKWL